MSVPHRTSKRFVTEDDLMELLRQRHAKDVFVGQCKNGKTWFGDHQRFDAWAMKRSWARPLTICYEIKVSRSDWLKDEKWHAGLDYCNEFYLVAPRDVIKVEEVPDHVGLLCPTSTLGRMQTLKKAPRREVKIPEELYRYILMSRVEIVPPRGGRDLPPEDTREFWHQWLEEKRELKDVGWRVSRRLRKLYQRDVEHVQMRQSAIERELEHLREAREMMERAGCMGSYDWRKRAQMAISGLPVHLEASLKGVKSSIDDALKEIEKLKARGAPSPEVLEPEKKRFDVEADI